MYLLIYTKEKTSHSGLFFVNHWRTDIEVKGTSLPSLKISTHQIPYLYLFCIAFDT